MIAFKSTIEGTGYTAVGEGNDARCVIGCHLHQYTRGNSAVDDDASTDALRMVSLVQYPKHPRTVESSYCRGTYLRRNRPKSPQFTQIIEVRPA
jgi:hypothetical protein